MCQPFYCIGKALSTIFPTISKLINAIIYFSSLFLGRPGPLFQTFTTKSSVRSFTGHTVTLPPLAKYSAMASSYAFFSLVSIIVPSTNKEDLSTGCNIHRPGCCHERHYEQEHSSQRPLGYLPYETFCLCQC